jgi:hypothetical protein
MNLVKVFLKNINVLNLLLLATAIFLFLKFNDSLIDKKINFTIFNPKEVLMETEEKAAVESVAKYLDYSVITEKNLFHPARKLAAEVKQEQQMARPEIILYGTLITDEKRIAYIEDKKSPYSSPGRGKRQVTVNEGDMIAGYKLVRVSAESILLVRGEDKITVTLSSESKERKSGDASSRTAASAAMPNSTSGQMPQTSQSQATRSAQPYSPPLPPIPARPMLNSR